MTRRRRQRLQLTCGGCHATSRLDPTHTQLVHYFYATVLFWRCPHCFTTQTRELTTREQLAVIGAGASSLDWTHITPDTPPPPLTINAALLFARLAGMDSRSLQDILTAACYRILGRQ